MTDEMLNLWKRLYLVRKQHHPEVIIVHHLWLLAAMVRSFPGIPVIGICHGTIQAVSPR